jgi:hypothetical protein
LPGLLRPANPELQTTSSIAGITAGDGKSLTRTRRV